LYEIAYLLQAENLAGHGSGAMAACDRRVCERYDDPAAIPRRNTPPAARSTAVMTIIESLDDPTLGELSHRLSELANDLDDEGAWPAEGLRLCQHAGVMRWFVPRRFDGLEWSEADILRGYMQLAAGCLSTTFVVTQPHGVIRRLLDTENVELRDLVLPMLVSGEAFASVGISQLTTSRRHSARPPMVVREAGNDIILDGLCPWVTGGIHADYVVSGGVLEDGRQALVLIPTDHSSVTFDPPASMVGLTATHTGSMRCRQAKIPRRWIIAGPSENVMAGRKGGNTGGLQTSALALGLAYAAIDYLAHEANQRDDLREPLAALEEEHRAIVQDMLAMTTGEITCSNDELRARANMHVLRATQSALTAAKGTGYLRGHPVGRWCREALFFLVWSCPQPVASATLCELAGLA